MRLQTCELKGDFVLFTLKGDRRTYAVKAEALDRRLGCNGRRELWPRSVNSYVAFLPGVGYRVSTEQGMLTLSADEMRRLVQEYVYLEETQDWTPQVWREFETMRAAATG